ncbi:hypothetical protein BSSC8_08570 [Bacillus subtilis subsp. subtilis str. SC-8]|nr:hypothetical protein BSSC8_08570 [Bacillus subtilis subsp. subtilis str. SC-8]
MPKNAVSFSIGAPDKKTETYTVSASLHQFIIIKAAPVTTVLSFCLPSRAGE